MFHGILQPQIAKGHAAPTAEHFVDTFRQIYDQDRLYSWWDYRAGDFHQGRGLRIDLVLATPELASRTKWAIVDRQARKGKQPSDHAPVIVDFADRTDAASGLDPAAVAVTGSGKP